MREILFRGRAMSKRWTEGLPYYARDFVGNPVLCIAPQYESARGAYEGGRMVDSDTVGQFTGLFSKDGSKIFEGDILKVHDALFRTSFVGEVTFHDGSFCIKEKQDDSLFHFNWSDYTTEILGNVYDTPELLEAQTNG